MCFGTAGRLKSRLAAELCATLAFSAIKSQDKVGLLLFTDRIEKFIPPKKGTKHVLRVIREVLSFSPAGRGTDIRLALEYLNRVDRRRAVTFLISDFFCEEIRSSLSVANRRHDLIAVHLTDPRQDTLPPVGWIELEDAETGRQTALNSSNPHVRLGYEAWAQDHRRRLDGMLRAAKVDLIELRTDRPYVDPLLKFFRMRSLRR